ncbi:MAG: hypothetical protein A2939_00295 [Parcubacteria group bacterium RIFCSPLOWO2_01_FULL_48_18]|nr:MAG: hypothetical protein A2939_00295 [Parcubacteria group bacterium RIFCSPLOWO2_01_FULL_48_18]
MGIVSSVGWASLGYGVISVDKDENVVASLGRGVFPVLEPHLEELWKKHHGRITYSPDFSLLQDCPLVILVRDTPTNDDNTGNTDVLVDLVTRALPHVAQNGVFVSMSQVPVGFSRKIIAHIKEKRPDVQFFMWVETFVFGEAIKRFLEPERIIVGVPDASNKKLPDIFNEALQKFNCPILVMGLESAELTKAAINVYLASSVTFTNTLADLCEATGADIDEIVPALQLDRRIGQYAYLRPSLGIGGGNIERDLAMLGALPQNKKPPMFIHTIVDYNARRFDWLKEKIEELVFSHVEHPRISLWGLAYKKNTKSLKNSPALKAIALLKDRATLTAYDPMSKEMPTDQLENIVIAPDKYTVLKDADCLIVLTDWDEFKEFDISKAAALMNKPVIIDTVKLLSQTLRNNSRSEIIYCSMGS